MSRLLIVEDEPALRRALAINLKARGYEVDAVGTGTAALRAAAAHPPELVLVDLGLPDLDGVEVIAGLRGWSRVPIIVLSARDTQQQKVRALAAGAADYVTKPFGMDELLARVRAALRRADVPEPSELPVIGTDSFPRPGRQAGPAARCRGEADADRVASGGGPGAASGHVGAGCATAGRGVGSRL